MKLISILILTVTLSFPLYSQTCTPSWTGSGYGIMPDTIVNLPPAYEGHLYSATVNFKVPADTMVRIGLLTTNVQINYIRIDSGFGLEKIPALVSFSSAANPADGIFKGDSTGCLFITGTPAMGSAGTYVITVYLTASVYIPLLSTDYEQHYVSKGYHITVLPDTTVTGWTENKLQFFNITPNPFSNTIRIRYYSLSIENMNLKVYSVLGKLVADKNVRTVTGINELDLNTEDFPVGEYFCTISSGNTRFTQKIIKNYVVR